MRLRLVIQRHALPPVQIVYTTGTGPASQTKSRDSTIADLLYDVNDLVPLESADGEWGLEDYVVEVVPAVDQKNKTAVAPAAAAAYECLHYQACEDVLREDDEVVIRALSSEELRIRRLGGRHQISGDGRHLIDGVTFGKQWLRRGRRPGIVIPPRKRRRLLSADHDGDETDEDQGRRILPADEDDYTGDYAGALVHVTSDDEDEEDDDYVDDDLQVAVSAEFDDADSEAESNHDSASEPSDAEAGHLQDDEDLSEEVKLLLKDAADVGKAVSATAARQLVRKQLKRKRDLDDEGEDQETSTFEGFSTPVNSSKQTRVNAQEEGEEEDPGSDSDDDSMLQEIAQKQAVKRAQNIMDDEEDEDDEEDQDVQDAGESSNSDTSSSGTSSADSDTDSMLEELAVRQAKKRALNLIQDEDEDSSDSSDYSVSVSDKAVGEDDTSSSGSDSGSDSDADSDSGSDADSDADESDSDSEPSSTSSSASSSSSSSSEAESLSAEPSGSAPHASSGLQPPTVGSDDSTKPKTTPPGNGTGRTHNNNNRAKKRKRLNYLKQQGILPEDADFRALAAYDEKHGSTESGPAAVTGQVTPAALGQTVEHAGEKRKAVTDDAMNGVDNSEWTSKAGEKSTSGPDDQTNIGASPAAVPLTSQQEEQAEMEPAPKRARLDLASSRRMLFSSLGLRTPKTPEAEQALREKLSKSVRPVRQPSAASAGTALPLPQHDASAKWDDSWKDKLIIAAVECEGQGGALPPPPFPFEQGWTKASNDYPSKTKRRARDQAQYYEDNQAQAQEEEQDGFAPDVSMLASEDVDESKLVDGPEPAAEDAETLDDIPIPTDFDGLPDLDSSSIVAGAVIAYKELHVDASTNYQPEISPFRVGRVSSMDEDGYVHLILAKGCLESSSNAKYDEETGERIYGKFEIMSDDADAQSDDGVREIQFSSMISPKLVQKSSVEVPDSKQSSGLRGGDGSDSRVEEQYAAIPETIQRETQSSKADDSQPSVDNIATPRRKEISDMIKEAGFNSALDEQLLLPVAEPSNQQNQPGSPELQSQSQEEYPHRFRKESPGLDLHATNDEASSEVDEDAGDHVAHMESPPAQPSSPFIHTQETVEYPHISQIEINSSGLHHTTDSSSHQDAQKIAPASPVDPSFTASDERDSGSEADHEDTELAKHEDSNLQQDSLQPLESEVPQSQSQALSFESFGDEADQGGSEDREDSENRRDSFLGPGPDGHDSSYHEGDAASEDDSDDLPSLLDITSGRSQATSARLRSRKVSPPLARRSLRRSKKLQSSTPPSSPDLLPSSSQPEIKLSQSQRQPSLSQIPAGSQVIDLTFSSSPQKHDAEFEIGKKAASQVNGHKKSIAQETKQESGLGKRRLLTTKKVRTYY